MPADRRSDEGDDAAALDWPDVDVVMPVMNEERNLRSAVERVMANDYAGDITVVLALGPSTDGTDRVAEELAAEYSNIMRADNPSGSTPIGLNIALRASHSPVVVRVDAHGFVPSTYVRQAVEILRATGAANVGGVMAAEGGTAFERAVARAMTSRIGIGSAPYHQGGSAGPAASVYLGVFRRDALERVGGFDESFARAQDWELNYRLRSAGEVVWFDPRLKVGYRPRSTVQALAKQFYGSGRWRREVIQEHAATASMRYLAPPAVVSLIVTAVLAGLVGLALRHLLAWALVLPVVYLVGVFVAAAATAGRLPWRARVWLPVVVVTMHVSWGAGFLRGSVRRSRAHVAASGHPMLARQGRP